jgi:hypothetical protein
MELVIGLRVGHLLRFHGGCRSHWVLSTDTDTVEELR